MATQKRAKRVVKKLTQSATGRSQSKARTTRGRSTSVGNSKTIAGFTKLLGDMENRLRILEQRPSSN